ncbi:stalk domain-containing protein [Heyndrickxia sp. NPDC080065]|uniref:stalk domain-containing protein n=1 Tax=Heyndrickxia sp. NPDC080065 TaxID=3390568 RepID=UPI003CFBDDC9
MFRRQVLKYLVIFLLFFIGSILYFQWNGFSSERKHNKGKEIQQKITIEHNNNKFYIEQTIQSIDNGVYEIFWPKEAKNIDCFIEENQECKWIKNKKIKISSGQVTLRYEIKRQMANSSLLLDNWLAIFKHTNVEASKIHLIEGQFKQGSWVAPTKNIAIKQMEYINYYVFDIKGQVPTLFWHKNELVKETVNSWLTIYYPKSYKLPKLKLNKLKKIKQTPNIVVVITNEIPHTTLPSFLIVNDDNKDDLEEEIVEEVMHQAFSFKSEEEWLKDIISSAILNKAIGSKKAQIMYSELKTKLGKELLNDWVDKILQEEDTNITSKRLDETIKEVTGFDTDFFSENRLFNSPKKEFVLYDARKIIVKGEERKDIHLILHEGKNVLPFTKTMDALGYKVENNKNNDSIDLKNKDNHFRFYFGKKLFLYNDEEYGLLSTPFIKIDDEYFIEINWLNQLFNTLLEEDKKHIRIK